MTTEKTVLQEQLSAGPMVVTFKKKDGTLRVMPCTTNAAIITSKHGSYEPIVPSDTLAVVYDLQLNEWRSFRWNSVISAIETGTV
jgi:WYL_2, Sm-like SH3 beta-barrel fold